MRTLPIIILFTLLTSGCRNAMTPREFNSEYKTSHQRLTQQQVEQGTYTRLRKANIRATSFTIKQDVHAAAQKVDHELDKMKADAYTLDHFMWIPTIWGTELSIDFTGYKSSKEK